MTFIYLHDKQNTFKTITMECLKNSTDDSMIGTTPECKSWVKTRFVTIFENGVQKRRCLHADCTKEYSRSTSHMILKRHWSRDHDDINSLSPRSKALFDNPDAPLTRLPPKRIIKKKKPLKVSNASPSGSAGEGTPTKQSKQLAKQNLISNNVFKPAYLDKVTLDVKQVSKRLKEATSIHLTFDAHTPKKGGKTFGIITAHSMDSHEIKSVLLDYKHLPYPDDPTSLYEFLRCCVVKFNIREKIISIASNCSECMASAVHELDKRFRLSKNFNFSAAYIKCFPQFIHMNVVDILRSQEHLMDSVRRIIAFINSNNFTLRPLPQGNSETQQQQQQQQQQNSTVLSVHKDTQPNNNNSSMDTTDSKTTELKLPIDNRNHWNSTYKMIESFIQQRRLIEPTFTYMQVPQDLAAANLDWERLYTLLRLLKPFYDIVHKFSVDNYAPVSLVAASIPHLMDHLSSSSWLYDDMAMAAHNFKMQLESYRQQFQSDLTVIAGLLDPRIKDTFISPEAKHDAIDILRKRLELNKSEVSTTHRYPEDSLWTQVFRPDGYNEVANFLDSPREHGYTCNVAYWEAHKHVYPSLYALAKTVACVQATSVPSDRMFLSNDVFLRESKISVDTVTSKELMKSWAKYLEK